MNKEQAKWLRERLLYKPVRMIDDLLWVVFVGLPMAAVVKIYMAVEKMQGKKPSK